MESIKWYKSELYLAKMVNGELTQQMNRLDSSLYNAKRENDRLRSLLDTNRQAQKLKKWCERNAELRHQLSVLNKRIKSAPGKLEGENPPEAVHGHQ